MTAIQITNIGQFKTASVNARAVRLHVRRTSIFRQYVVENRTNGQEYVVNFFVTKAGERWATCECPARVPCKHIYAALGLHLVVAAERQPTAH